MRLFSRADWNRGWLYDSALALGTLNAVLFGNAIDQAFRDAGMPPAVAFVFGFVAMGLIVGSVVVLLWVPDRYVPDRLPTAGDVRTQSRLFKIPAAVVFPWFVTLLALASVAEWAFAVPALSPNSFIFGHLVGSVVALTVCGFLAARQTPRRQQYAR